jgi:hypothetical protein
MAGAMLLLCLCLIACNRLGRSSNAQRSSDNRGPAASSAPTFERPLQLAAPRTLKYADLQITVTRGVISDRPPDVTQSDSANPATADLTLQVLNTLNDAVRIRSGLWQLRLGNGGVYKTPFEDNFEARDTQERRISFRVPLAAEWAGAQLVFDEQGKEPASLTLDGDAAPAQYPIALSAKGEATTKDPALTYSIKSASLDVDAFGHRVEEGKRYLNLTVQIADKETGGADEFLPEFIRLLVDGAPAAPESADDNTTIGPARSVEHRMAFVIPANATNVELEVGKSGVQQTAKIPIDLKPPKS